MSKILIINNFRIQDRASAFSEYQKQLGSAVKVSQMFESFFIKVVRLSKKVRVLDHRRRTVFGISRKNAAREFCVTLSVQSDIRLFGSFAPLADQRRLI